MLMLGSAGLTRFIEWEIIQGLSYRAHAGEEADFVKLMYTIRLKKVRRRTQVLWLDS